MFQRPVCIGALTILSACGGKVIFVDEGAGGAPATTTSSISSVSSTASGQPSACSALCNAPQCANEGGECSARCEETLPGCEAQGDAFLACAAANLDTSTCALAAPNPPTTPYAVCSGERYDFLVCRLDHEHCQFAGDCQAVSGPPHDVFCQSTCDFGALSAHCSDPDEDGVFHCDCSLNGSVVASCDGSVFFGEEPECCQRAFLGLDDFVDTTVDDLQ